MQYMPTRVIREGLKPKIDRIDVRNRLANPNCPRSANELRNSELQVVLALRRLGFGRLEGVRVENGEIILNPWPTTVHTVKFGSNNRVQAESTTFELKKQVAEFFDFVRSIKSATLR